MIDLPFADYRRRVLVSRERVKFAHADPYGHLASGAYVDMVMSHRVEALEEGLVAAGLQPRGSSRPKKGVDRKQAQAARALADLDVWMASVGAKPAPSVSLDAVLQA